MIYLWIYILGLVATAIVFITINFKEKIVTQENYDARTIAWALFLFLIWPFSSVYFGFHLFSFYIAKYFLPKDS